MHSNAQAEGSHLASATDGIETNATSVVAELNGADSPGTDSLPTRENTEISLPSARKLSVRRSRRTRRNIHTSVGDNHVEIVVQGCEGNALELEPGTGTLLHKAKEGDQENELLQLQDRLVKKRCVSAV